MSFRMSARTVLLVRPDPAGDDASGVNTECDATLCSANEHVVSHVCTTCPPGTSNAVGNHDASGPDTECDTNPSKKSFMLEYVWIGTGILGAVLSFFSFIKY